jgi:tripartite ATP-independent transporter DctM subunit
MSVVAAFGLMGFIALHSGIGSKLFEFAYRAFGRAPGGLAIATEGACAAFGAICGSGPATVSTIGSIAYPEMKKYGYADSLSTASIAAGGGLGMLIPPSVTAIIYGVMTETSIGQLFMGGICGGILLMLMYMLVIFIMVKVKPSIAPRSEHRYTMKEKLEAINGGLLETAIIFVVTIGGLMLGFFTPVEGGAVGASAMLIVVVIRRKLNFKKFMLALYDTGRMVGMVFLLFAAAAVFQRFVVISNLPQLITDFLTGIDAPPKVVFMIIIVIFLIGGCFLDGLPLIFITIPIFFPVIMDMGFDAVWFGVIVTIIITLGAITPPVGTHIFIISGLTKVPIFTAFRGVWPFVGAILATIVIAVIWPDIFIFLPRLAY